MLLIEEENADKFADMLLCRKGNNTFDSDFKESSTKVKADTEGLSAATSISRSAALYWR